MSNDRHDAIWSDPHSYPSPLAEAEAKLLRERPERAASGVQDWVGIGLSGGGIRSATFCLGVFQALGRLGLLGKIDYTSSVSGGGYFTSFYGRLFTRKEVQGLDQIAGILAPNESEPANAGTNNWMRRTFTWLRENGRYLSPHGAGDFLLDIAVVLRNSISLQLVMAIFVLMFLLLMQGIRLWSRRFFCGETLAIYKGLSSTLPGDWGLSWSPYLPLGLAFFLFLAIPPGWAYWLLGGQRARSRSLVSWIGSDRLDRLIFFSLRPWTMPVAVGVLAGYRLYHSESRDFGLVLKASLFISVLTLILAVVVALYAGHRAEVIGQERPAGKPAENVDPSDFAGNLLSRASKVAMIISLGCIGFALIDSLGQTVARIGLAGSGSWAISLVAPIAAAVPLAPFAQWLVTSLDGHGKGRKIGLPLGIIAGVAAVLLIVPSLILLDYVAHLIARKGCGLAALDPTAIAYGLLVTFLFSLAAGYSRHFLNSSSLHSLYTARLVRAYLGASNPGRFDNGLHPATDVMPGDDISQEDYWLGSGEALKKGAPLHLVNVTVNETYGGRSEIEQRDRKGLGMAVGPAGVSVGVENHVVFASRPVDGGKPMWLFARLRGWWRSLRSSNRPNEYGEVAIFPANDDRRAFRYPVNAYDGQRLALGSWTGISGAAFSTGLGSRTNLALSLLTGFFNVRLGYWWDSGIKKRCPRLRAGALLGALFNRVFPVQRALINEFLSRFPGTSEKYWYLSDGGHFENMGGYELIRRRLPLMVIIDAEADPDYRYEGLANLVRKARLDFGAEVEFLDAAELDQFFTLGPDPTSCHPTRSYFGTLDQLRRGTWIEEPVADPVTHRPRVSLTPPDRENLSLAHAALAKINYASDPEAKVKYGYMIVIKPTLTGDEPADVLQYHAGHSSFPHETTADQWFDEEQWESYRKLGEHIATRVFEMNDSRGPLPTFARS